MEHKSKEAKGGSSMKRILSPILFFIFGLFAACVISLCELMNLTLEVEDEM